MRKPWIASVALSGEPPSDIHILPVGDLCEHREARTCWCEPEAQTVEGSRTVIVVHHAADGRELVEEHGLQ